MPRNNLQILPRDSILGVFVYEIDDEEEEPLKGFHDKPDNVSDVFRFDESGKGEAVPVIEAPYVLMEGRGLLF